MSYNKMQLSQKRKNEILEELEKQKAKRKMIVSLSEQDIDNNSLLYYQRDY